MKLLGKILLLALAGLGLVFLLYFAGSKGWLKNTPLKNLDYEQLNFISSENLEQAQMLSERAKETTGHVQQILGDKIEVDEQAESQKKDKAIHQKAIEYTRYLYCKQVVDEWEATDSD